MHGKQRETVFCFLAAGCAGLILLVVLLLPLGFDNDIYQSMGWTLYKYHGLPYLSSWDHNFPGIVYVHALSITLFGNSDLGFRALDTILHALLAGLYFRLLRRWVDTSTAFVAMILLTLYYVGGAWDLVGQRDGYAVLFLLAGSLAFFRARDRSKDPELTTSLPLLFLGFCMSCAILMRPTYGLFSLSFLILVAIFGQRLRNVIIYLLGCVIPFALFLIPYVFVNGGVEQLYDSLIRFNLELYSGTRVPVNFFTHGRGILYLLALAGVILTLRKNGIRVWNSEIERQDKTWLLLISASALLSPIIMGKYFIYHFEPFMAIVTAFSAIGLIRILSASRLPIGIGITAALVIFAVIFYPRHLVGYYVKGLQTNEPLQYTYKAVLSDSLTGYEAQNEVVRYLDQHLNPSEEVEYASFFLGLRWRSHRPQATRFTTPIALCISARDSSHPWFQQEWRREFIDSLTRRKPAYIILNTGQRQWWPFIHAYIDDAVHELPGFQELLAHSYAKDTVIRGFTFYRRRV